MTNEKFSSFERELDESGKLIFTNVGVSMLPLLREKRDVMVITKLSENPKKLQAVLFRRNGVEGRGKYVLHRIVKIRKDGKFFIVGDNCTDGEIVDKNDILGVLSAVIRDGKQIDFKGLKYRLYLYFWCAPYHLRFFLLKFSRAVKYFFYAIRKKLFGK